MGLRNMRERGEGLPGGRFEFDSVPAGARAYRQLSGRGIKMSKPIASSSPTTTTGAPGHPRLPRNARRSGHRRRSRRRGFAQSNCAASRIPMSPWSTSSCQAAASRRRARFAPSPDTQVVLLTSFEDVQQIVCRGSGRRPVLPAQGRRCRCPRRCSAQGGQGRSGAAPAHRRAPDGCLASRRRARQRSARITEPARTRDPGPGRRRAEQPA